MPRNTSIYSRVDSYGARSTNIKEESSNSTPNTSMSYLTWDQEDDDPSILRAEIKLRIKILILWWPLFINWIAIFLWHMVDHTRMGFRSIGLQSLSGVWWIIGEHRFWSRFQDGICCYYPIFDTLLFLLSIGDPLTLKYALSYFSIGAIFHTFL